MTIIQRRALLVLVLFTFPSFAEHNVPATPHTLTVESGTGSGPHQPKDKITITAPPPPPGKPKNKTPTPPPPPPAGKYFDHWTATPATLKLKNPDHSSFIFQMPDADVALAATYTDIAPHQPLRVACVGDSITEITGYP